MKDIISYKNFIGSAHFSSKDEVFYGRIEGIQDLVTFEGSSVKALKKSFHEAVDDYLDLCISLKKDPYKSFKGSFNVRIKPELHSKLFGKAIMTGKTLNQLVQEAIEKEVV